LRDSTDILDLFSKSLHAGKKMVMATVVDVDGSAYRRPGAHMLLTEDELHAGSISAGCLENDIVARSEDLFSNQKSVLLQYDSNEFFGLNYGCDGTILVLVEPLTESGISFPNAVKYANAESKTLVMATVFDSIDAELVGCKISFSDDQVIQSELSPELERLVASKLPEVRSANRNQTIDFEELKVRVFFETVKPNLRLIVFGAGDDVIPVVEMARSIGFDVHVIDTRRSYLDRQAERATIHQFGESSFADSNLFDAPERTAAVVMSHNFELDKRFVDFVLKQEFAYVGLMGSRKRTKKLLEELLETKTDLAKKSFEEGMARIHYPIGLDLGAESPEEIALSICGEVLSFFRKTSAQSLSRIAGPVHLRDSDRNIELEGSNALKVTTFQCTTGNTNE